MFLECVPINKAPYPIIYFIMAKIMEINNNQQNQVAMYVYKIYRKRKTCTTEAIQGKVYFYWNVELPFFLPDGFPYTEQAVVTKDVKCLTSIVHLVNGVVVRIHTCLDSEHILQWTHRIAICVEHRIMHQCSPIRVKRYFGIMIGSQCTHEIKNPLLEVVLLGRELFFGKVFFTHHSPFPMCKQERLDKSVWG